MFRHLVSRVCLLIIVLVHVSYAADKVDFTKYSKRSNDNKKIKTSVFKRQVKDEDGRIAGTTGVLNPAYPWVIALYEGTTTYLGIAGIVNNYWCATHSSVTEDYEGDATVLVAYQGLASNALPVDPAIIPHQGKLIVPHPDVEGEPPNKNAMTLVKFCPPWRGNWRPPAASPPGSLSYPEGTALGFINYATDHSLVTATKNTGEVCECELVVGYDKTLDVCMELDSDIHNEATDVGSLLVSGTKFAGINLIGTDMTGETYLDLKKYNTYIRSHAIIL